MNEPLIYVYTYIDTGLKIYIRPANVALSCLLQNFTT